MDLGRSEGGKEEVFSLTHLGRKLNLKGGTCSTHCCSVDESPGLSLQKKENDFKLGLGRTKRRTFAPLSTGVGITGLGHCSLRQRETLAAAGKGFWEPLEKP